MKTFYLIDQVRQEVVKTVRNPEDAVRWLGAYMSLVSPQACVGQFVLTHSPIKSGKALIEYSSDELWKRALVYLDQFILNKRTAKTAVGKWART